MDADAAPTPVITAGPTFLSIDKQVKGFEPISVVAGSNGVVYAATVGGGTLGYGSLFSFDPASGIIRTLHDFGPPEGAEPMGGLLYSDGILYGTTIYGGVNDSGTIFSCDTAGHFQTLYQFDGQSNGSNPLGGLAFGMNGDLYTTALYSGKYRVGAILDFTGGDDSPNHHFSFNPQGDPGDGGRPRRRAHPG